MSDQIKDLRELLTLGAKAGGMDVTDPKWAEFLQNEEFAVPLRADFLSDIKTLFYKMGLKNDGIKAEIEKARKDGRNKTHGTVSEQAERRIIEAAKSFGLDELPFQKAIEETRGDHNKRWDTIFKYFHDAGEANGSKKAGNDSELNLEIKRLKSLHDGQATQINSLKESFQKEKSALQKQHEDYKTAQFLMSKVKSGVKFNSKFPKPMIDAEIEKRVNGVMGQYNIIIKNGEALYYDKEDPTQVVFLEGEKLTTSQVLINSFGEEYLEKQDANPDNSDNGGRRITSQGKDLPQSQVSSHVKDWALKMEQNLPKR